MKLIPLTHGKFAMVDDADYRSLNQWTWNLFAIGNVEYARRTVRGGVVLMHIQIFGSKFIDHQDRNGLNNQRDNLRPATKSQNGANRGLPVQNTSGFKGIHWNDRRGRWCAEITCQYKKYSLGRFKILTDAARAYDEAAVRFFGEFAKTNKSLGLLP